MYDPIDWKIANDTIVQPDLLVVCKQIENVYLDFPPALVIEILSPSTASKDRNEKKELYLSQKVKYYLIVDPQFRKAEVYEYSDGQYQLLSNEKTHTFLLDDDCNINVDLTNIWD